MLRLGIRPPEVCVPAGLEARIEPAITRQRAIQLVLISEKVAQLVEKLGVTEHEYCYFGNLMNDILRFPTK